MCGKAFGRKGELTVHNRIHSGERPCKCKVSEKSFARNDHLTVHNRIHSGERLYKCEVCGKAFRQHKSLKSYSETSTEFCKDKWEP